jgi:hypothetical protein
VISPSLKWSYDSSDDKDLEDVSLVWHFSSGKLVRVFADYDTYRPRTLIDFITQTAKKLDLPSNSFKVTGQHQAKIVCKDFSLELIHGEFSHLGWDPEGARLILEDTDEIKRLDKEMADYKSEQLRKRNTLKP